MRIVSSSTTTIGASVSPSFTIEKVGKHELEVAQQYETVEGRQWAEKLEGISSIEGGFLNFDSGCWYVWLVTWTHSPQTTDYFPKSIKITHRKNPLNIGHFQNNGCSFHFKNQRFYFDGSAIYYNPNTDTRDHVGCYFLPTRIFDCCHEKRMLVCLFEKPSLANSFVNMIHKFFRTISSCFV